MPDLHHYLLFIAAGLMLNITPGADMLFVITTAGRHGISRGLAGAVGVFGGTLVHIVCAVVGLSAMLAASAWAFSIVKYIGAAYLLYLGISLLLSRSRHDFDAGPPIDDSARTFAPLRLATVFRRGVLINVLNPKVVLFFLAFLPQFIDPSAGNHWLAFALLGLTFNVTGTLVNAAAAVATVGLGQLPWVRRAGRWAQRAVGVLFVGLAARLALEPTPQ